MPHAIAWFEIPAVDLARTVEFYEAILATKLTPMAGSGRKMAAFPADWSKGEISGCVCQAEDLKASHSGTVVFLNCAPDLAPALARVERAGGKVLMPKTKIPMGDAGYMALLEDTEGNRVGLFSPG